MAARRRGGLGSGLANLIPANQREQRDSPVDVFFANTATAVVSQETETAKTADEAKNSGVDGQGFGLKDSMGADGTRAGQQDSAVGEQRGVDASMEATSSMSRETEAEDAADDAKKSDSGNQDSDAADSTGQDASREAATAASGETDAADAVKAAKEPDPGEQDSDAEEPKGVDPSTEAASFVSRETETEGSGDDTGKSGVDEQRSVVEESPAPDVAGTGKQDAATEESSGTETSDKAGQEHSDGESRSEATQTESARAEEANPTRETAESKAVPEPETDDSADAKEQLIAVPGVTYGEIPVEQIVPNRRQPRTVFDEDELLELAESIAEVGVLQPVIVRPLPRPLEDNPNARYELIMGERRWRASQLAGKETIPSIVRRTTDEHLLRDALLENLHRTQLNPLEEAAAYQQLLEDFGCTQEELSKRLARSRPQISNTLRLLKLPPLVQQRVAAQIISAGHARALLSLPDPVAMEKIAQRIVAERLSVRKVEEIVAMWDDPDASRKPARRRRVANPELEALGTRLGDRFETKVKITMGTRKGSIKIDFAGRDDLNRILAVLAPEMRDSGTLVSGETRVSPEGKVPDEPYNIGY